MMDKGIDQTTLDSLFPLPSASPPPAPLPFQTRQSAASVCEYHHGDTDESDNQLLSSPKIIDHIHNDRNVSKVLHHTLFKKQFKNKALYKTNQYSDSSSSDSHENESTSDSSA